MAEFMNDQYHIPVLVSEVLTYLAPQPGGLYVDCTFGGGGHTRAILQAEPACRVIAIDWDCDSFDQHEKLFMNEFGDRIQLIWGNFAQLMFLLKRHNIEKVDGILADFGTSQHQIFSARGFSFVSESPLDMRMSPAHQRITAAQVVNKAPEQELIRIFMSYGQEHAARAIARAIVAERKEREIVTARQLAQVIEKVSPRAAAPRGKSKIHPATKVFQALRIHVNHELENIKGLLESSVHVLADGGKLVCISFHSLEDGLVKNFMRTHACAQQSSGCFELLTKQVITANTQEVAANPAARSARLRAAQWHDKLRNF